MIPSRARPALPLALALVGACEPKEAQDPADILAEDPTFLQPRYEHARDPNDEPPARPESTDSKPPARLATHGECRAAVRHLEELGIDLAIAEETDRERRRQLTEEKTQLLESPAVQRRIRRGAEDCVARGTTAAEAACIAEVDSAEAIDACH